MFTQWIFLISCFTIGIYTQDNWSIKSVPTTVEPFQNNNVILPCYISDNEKPITVRWMKDDVQLADSSDTDFNHPERITMYENKSLGISHVQPEDSGQYDCQVSRAESWGSVRIIYVIKVKYPPKILRTIPNSGELEVNLGEEADMSCVATGYPEPIFSWKMKDMEIQMIDDYSRLRLKADNRTLAGPYTCVATNGIGDSAQAVIELRIKHKPEIETRKRWVHVSPGIRTQLDCEVTAWPEAQVDWYFMNDRIVYDSRMVKHISGLTHSLVIRNVRQSDYGNYRCRASNSLGTTEKVIELSGVVNPPIIKGSRSIGKNAYYFVWEVDSYGSIIEYQFWFRKYPTGDWHKVFIPSGSDAIGPLHTKSFNLTGLEEATLYEALVLSRNRYGWSKPSKVIRFATDKALPETDAHNKINKTFEESATDNNSVILDSLFQHYPTLIGNSSKPSSSSVYRSFTLVPIITSILHFFL